MIRHPPPVIIRPILRSRPLLVSGMPIDLEILDFAAEIPTNRFHENPPKFIFGYPSYCYIVVSNILEPITRRSRYHRVCLNSLRYNLLD